MNSLDNLVNRINWISKWKEKSNKVSLSEEIVNGFLFLFCLSFLFSYSITVWKETIWFVSIYVLEKLFLYHFIRCHFILLNRFEKKKFWELLLVFIRFILKSWIPSGIWSSKVSFSVDKKSFTSFSWDDKFSERKKDFQ